MSDFWMSLFVFVVVGTMIQYILGGALITEPLRNILPRWLQTLLRCPSCCGWWIGIVCGFNDDIPVPVGDWPFWLCILWYGCVGGVLIPVVRGFMLEVRK